MRWRVRQWMKERTLFEMYITWDLDDTLIYHDLRAKLLPYARQVLEKARMLDVPMYLNSRNEDGYELCVKAKIDDLLDGFVCKKGYLKTENFFWTIGKDPSDCILFDNNIFHVTEFNVIGGIGMRVYDHNIVEAWNRFVDYSDLSDMYFVHIN
jgi:hypothetical protein